MPKQIPAFKCEHCSRKAFTRRTIEKHEKRCWHNPGAKTCWTCGKSIDNGGTCILGAVEIIVNCAAWEA